MEAWTWVESESWAGRFVGLDTRAGVDTFEGFEEAAAWEYVMGWTLILISEGIDDLTPDGLPAVPLEPGGLLVLEPLSTFPLELVLLVLGRELLAEFWAAEAEFWVEAGKFWLDETGELWTRVAGVDKAGEDLLCLALLLGQFFLVWPVSAHTKHLNLRQNSLAWPVSPHSGLKQTSVGQKP